MERNVPKLRFKGFNDEWKEKKLGEIITYKKGYAFKSQECIEKGVRVIKISDTNGDSINADGNTFINIDNYAKYKEWKLDSEDILVSTVGSRPPLYSSMVGKVVKVPKACEGSLLNQNLVKIKPIESISNNFLYNVLKKPRYTKFIENICRGNANQVSITLEDLFEYKILIPSLQEQERIANFLTKVDKIIEKQEEKVKNLENYKKGMMQKIFSQEIRFKDENGEEYPEWEEKRLKEITIVLDNMRKPLSANERQEIKGDIPYYGANGIVDYIDDYIFDERLILLAEDGGNFDEFASKPIAQIIDGKTWVNNHAHVLRTINSYVDYIFYTLVHKDIRKYINGTSRAKLNQADMLEIVIPFPCLEEQIKIANFLDKIYLLIVKESIKLEELRQCKKGLLQQMFV